MGGVHEVLAFLFYFKWNDIRVVLLFFGYLLFCCWYLMKINEMYNIYIYICDIIDDIYICIRIH